MPVHASVDYFLYVSALPIHDLVLSFCILLACISRFLLVELCARGQFASRSLDHLPSGRNRTDKTRDPFFVFCLRIKCALRCRFIICLFFHVNAMIKTLPLLRSAFFFAKFANEELSLHLHPPPNHTYTRASSTNANEWTLERERER